MSGHRSVRLAAESAYLGALGVTDIAVLSMWALGILETTVAVGAHAGLAAGVWLVPQLRRDATIGMFAMLAMFALGPLAVFGLIRFLGSLHSRALGSRGSTAQQATAKLQGKATAHAICEDLVEGRARDTQPATVRSFAAVLEKGELTDKQAMLGSLSLNFHAEQLPVLKSALVSEEAAVRVSAAAVFARLRETYRRASLAGADPVPSHLSEGELVARAVSLAEAARSGLLDDGEAIEARKAALELLLRARPEWAGFDDVEKLLCELLLELAHHEQLETRIEPAGSELPIPLRNMLMRSRMRSGRHDRLTEIASPLSGKIMEFPIRRPMAQSRPLLTDPAQAG